MGKTWKSILKAHSISTLSDRLCDAQASQRLVRECSFVPRNEQEVLSLEQDKHETQYLPILCVDDFWITEKTMGPAVSDLESLTSTLEVSLGDIGLGRWRIYKNIELGLRDQIAKLGGTEDEVNEVKEIVIGSDPLLLAISMLVSLLHMLFEVNGLYGRG